MDGGREAKVYLVLNLVSTVKGKKCTSISAAKESYPLLNRVRHIVAKDMEEAEVANATITLVVTGMTFLQESSAPRTGRKIESNTILPSTEKD